MAEVCEDLWGEMFAAADDVTEAEAKVAEAWDDWAVAMAAYAAACGFAAVQVFADPWADVGCAAAAAAAYEAKLDVEQAEAELEIAQEQFDEALAALDSCLECYHEQAA